MSFFFMDTDIKIKAVIEGTLQIIAVLIKKFPFQRF